jgi:hypothetical protein
MGDLASEEWRAQTKQEYQKVPTTDITIQVFVHLPHLQDDSTLSE